MYVAVKWAESNLMGQATNLTKLSLLFLRACNFRVTTNPVFWVARDPIYIFYLLKKKRHFVLPKIWKMNLVLQMRPRFIWSMIPAWMSTSYRLILMARALRDVTISFWKVPAKTTIRIYFDCSLLGLANPLLWRRMAMWYMSGKHLKLQKAGRKLWYR